MEAQRAAAVYDGAGPFPGSAAEAWTGRRRLQVVATGLIVTLPSAGLAAAVWLLWGHGLGFADVLLAAGFYTVTGLGVTLGFHRLITHHSAPACARHGTGRHQIDLSAALIRNFERLGWATAVRWPAPAHPGPRRPHPSQARPDRVLQPAGR
jgi:fatty-acid desaturase